MQAVKFTKKIFGHLYLVCSGVIRYQSCHVIYPCGYYRACLLATVRTSGASQSTLKLVATSLIANGKLHGKQLQEMLSRLGQARCVF